MPTASVCIAWVGAAGPGGAWGTLALIPASASIRLAALEPTMRAMRANPVDVLRSPCQARRRPRPPAGHARHARAAGAILLRHDCRPPRMAYCSERCRALRDRRAWRDAGSAAGRSAARFQCGIRRRRRLWALAGALASASPPGVTLCRHQSKRRPLVVQRPHALLQSRDAIRTCRHTVRTSCQPPVARRCTVPSSRSPLVAGRRPNDAIAFAIVLEELPARTGVHPARDRECAPVADLHRGRASRHLPTQDRHPPRSVACTWRRASPHVRRVPSPSRLVPAHAPHCPVPGARGPAHGLIARVRRPLRPSNSHRTPARCPDPRPHSRLRRLPPREPPPRSARRSPPFGSLCHPLGNAGRARAIPRLAVLPRVHTFRSSFLTASAPVYTLLADR